MDLGDLNRLPADEAAKALAACCASPAWVTAMAAGRPYPDLAALLAAAEEVWWGLHPDDWVEAFDAHPLIGEPVAGADTPSGWSREEQSGVDDADADLLRLLAECNRAYEERFGYTFLVFATGRSGAEILELCRARLHNDEIKELTVAAAEHARITNLRLRRLVGAA